MSTSQLYDAMRAPFAVKSDDGTSSILDLISEIANVDAQIAELGSHNEEISKLLAGSIQSVRDVQNEVLGLEQRLQEARDMLRACEEERDGYLAQGGTDEVAKLQMQRNDLQNRLNSNRWLDSRERLNDRVTPW